MAATSPSTVILATLLVATATTRLLSTYFLPITLTLRRRNTPAMKLQRCSLMCREGVAFIWLEKSSGVLYRLRTRVTVDVMTYMSALLALCDGNLHACDFGAIATLNTPVQRIWTENHQFDCLIITKGVEGCPKTVFKTSSDDKAVNLTILLP